MNKNLAIISIETTGINPSKNHIYSINVFTNDRYYRFYSKSNDTEELIIKNSYKLLAYKKIICFNNFDMNFFNSKIIKYTQYNVLNDYFSLQDILKNYYNNEFSSVKSNYLAKKLFDIELDDKSKSVKIYKKYSKENKFSSILIDYAKTSLDFKIQLYNYILEYFQNNSANFSLFGAKSNYLLYNLKIDKNNLIVNLITDNTTDVDSIVENVEIKSNGMFLQLRLSLHEGYIGNNLVECVITDMKNDYDLINNFYPLIQNGEFLYENIEKIINYTLKEMTNE